MNDSSPSSDALLIANRFRRARDDDTMRVLNAFSSKKQSDLDDLVFYVVSTRWMSRAWPILSAGQPPAGVIEDDNDNMNSGSSDSTTDWRVNLARIENAHLLEEDGQQQSSLSSSSSALNAVSNSSDDEEEDGGGSSANADNDNDKKQQQQQQRPASLSSSPARDQMMHELHMVQQKRKSQQNDITQSSRLRPNVSPDIDFVLLGPNIWMLLKQRFGYDVEIPRKCVFSTSGAQSPLAIEVQPAKGSLAPIRVPIPPGGHFRYETVFQQQQSYLSSASSVSASDTATASKQMIITPPLAAEDNASDSLNNSSAVEAGSGAGAGAGVAKTEEKQFGNVSDDETADEYDLIPTVDDEDRMSTDHHLHHHHDDEQHQQQSNNQSIILLPASTTATAAASVDNTAAATSVSLSNNYHNPLNNDPLSPSTPSSSSWYNNINNYGNNNNNNSDDDGDDKNTEIIVPGPLRNPYGSGLGNLGNTCFMNSTLQCLAHTDPLRKYFLSGEFERDLNRNNPLGTGGDLAVQFASLLGEIWGTNGTKPNTFGNVYQSNNIGAVVYPRNFKYTLGRHAEQFVGYDQHDSQELATYLLDALHEDTNRVTFKPYVEKPEQGEDESDEEASNKAWELHLKREDSQVLEYFMGQVKSRVQCCKENCGRVSTTFDPFMYLSVPIPGSSERKLGMTFVPLDPTMLPQYIPITISKTAALPDIRKKFVEQLKKLRIISEDNTIAQEDLCFCDVFQHDIYAWFSEDYSVDKIRDNDQTNVYQLLPLAGIRKLEAEHAAAPGGGVEYRLQEAGMRGRSTPKRYHLDLGTLTRLNRGDAWTREVSEYLLFPLGFSAAFNPLRGSTAERVKWYHRFLNFIDLCYKEAEDSELAAGSKRMRDDDDSINGAEHVSPDEDPVPSIDERCLSSEYFKNVSRRYDVAILEFVVNKMRSEILKMEKQKTEAFPDGILIQVRIRKYQPWGVLSKETSLADPLVLRIPSNTTVYGLRKILSKRLARILRTDHQYYRQSLASAATGESTSERPSTTIVSDGDSAGAHSTDCFNDPKLLIIRQIPLAYEIESIKTSLGTQLGSLDRAHSRDTSGGPGQIASQNDEEEKVLLAQVVGPRGKVYMEWSEELADRYLDLEEYAKTVDHQNSGEEESLVSARLSVFDCIEKYCQKEQLEESEMWYCNRCKEHVRAWKQFHLYRSPPILIVHLKRFMFSATTHRRDKINTFINFPLEGLDLTGQVMHWTEKEKPIYDCYAVSNHYGGLGGGHYTAYALTDDGTWCHYDDSRVTTDVDPKDVVSEAAYVMYYRRRDVPVGEEFVVNMQSTPGASTPGAPTPAIIQDPLTRIGESSDDVSCSNAAMVDSSENMDMDTDLASRSTSPMGSTDGNGAQFDPVFDTHDGKLDDLPLQ